MPTNEINQVAADKLAIIETVYRYARIVDDHDLGLLSECFEDTVIVELNGGDQIVKGLPAFTEVLRLGHETLLSRTTHLMCNTIVDIAADDATASTSAINAAFFAASPGQISLRGLRYQDQLRRGSDGWRIVYRRHTVDWQFQAPSSSLSTMNRNESDG